MTKRGSELFADRDVHVLRQIDTSSKPTAFVVCPWAPLNHPELDFFSSVLRVNESDQWWGVTKYPFSERLREGIPRRP